jgi:hypothetical protein
MEEYTVIYLQHLTLWITQFYSRNWNFIEYKVNLWVGLSHTWVVKNKRVVQNSQYLQNYFSSWETVKHGAPHRSVLGPVLFIIYTNDLPLNIRPISVVIMYTDDTGVLVSKPNYNEFKHAFNFVIIHTVNWFHATQLILNMNKIL